MKLVKRFFTVNIVMLCVLSAQAEARMKCWEGDDGGTICGDSVPPGAIERGFREFDNRGIPRRRVEPVPTQEEIERQRALDELRAEQDKLRAEQEEYDSKLLALYLDLDDLLSARDRKITQLDDQIRFAQDEIRRLEVRLSKLQAAAAGAERLGEQPTTQQRAEIETTNRSIEDYRTFILGKENEKKATIEQYDFDLKRYRELRPDVPSGADADLAEKSDN